MKKQSSIEWYLEQVNILEYRYNGRVITLGEYVNEKNRLENQAKQMHKQEIIEATLYGWRKSTEVNSIEPNEFYKNTYEKEN